MTGSTTSSEYWLGLCPKSPGLHAAPVAMFSEPEVVRPAVPGGNEPAGRPGRIHDGISIAVSGLKALAGDRQLLGFTSLAGLIMLFLVLVEGWNHRYIDPLFPITVIIWERSFYVDWQYLWIGIPIGNSHYIFYFGFFLIELACIAGFVFVLAGILQYRIGRRGIRPVTIREGFSMVYSSLGSLVFLSIGMAFIATVANELTFDNMLFSGIISSVMQLFWLPYAYYEPYNWMVAAVYYSASFISVTIMVINAFLFLAVLYLVPVIVLEKNSLPEAITRSVFLLKCTWREILGCISVGAIIVLGIFSAGVLIGQTPALLNHDYDFFLSASRGYFPMMAICYGFIIAAWVLMAAGFTAAGVAVADLYLLAKTGQVPASGQTEST